MGGRKFAGIILLCFGLSAWASVAEAGDMEAPLPMLQMNPLMLRYMGYTASDALQDAGQRHRISIQEHYANIFLADHVLSGIKQKVLTVPYQYLVDMELSVTDVTLRASVGKLGLHLDLPVLLPTGGWGDGLVNGFHKTFHFPNANRQYRPNNSYGYMLKGTWYNHAQLELGNISAGLSYPVQHGEHNALNVRAGIKAPTANRLHGWGSGTWDAGVGLVDSFRAGSWFTHVEGWYFRPFGSDYLLFLKNRPYARGSLAVGVKGRLFSLISDKQFSFVVQTQGGMTPYRGNDLLLTAQNPWLVAFGLRWQDAHARDWLFSITENITQHSTQDISFNLGCSFG